MFCTSHKEFTTDIIFKMTLKNNIIFLQMMFVLFWNVRSKNLVRKESKLWTNVLPSLTQRWWQIIDPNRPIHHYHALWQQFSQTAPWELQTLHCCLAFGGRVTSEIIYSSYLYRKIHFRLICITKVTLFYCELYVFYIIKGKDVIRLKAFAKTAMNFNIL